MYTLVCRRFEIKNVIHYEFIINFIKKNIEFVIFSFIIA